MKIKDAIHYAVTHLHEQEAAQLEAELLLAHAMNQSRSYLKAWPDADLNHSQQQVFIDLVRRRANGEPIAYILERREFWDLELRVTPACLIPRPETELLVELALQLIPTNAPWKIADLGTGSGAIALAIAKHRPTCRIIATDTSETALKLAQDNAAQLRITNVDFHLGNWFDCLAAQRFQLIVSNPPYVADNDPHLSQGDLRFEPATALSSGPEGLEDIRQIINAAPDHLEPGGWLLLEHGYDQATAVTQLFRDCGFTNVSTQADLAHRERVTYGKFI